MTSSREAVCVQIWKRSRFVYCTQNDLVSCSLMLAGWTVMGAGDNCHPEALLAFSGAANAQFVVFEPAGAILEKDGIPPCGIGLFFHSAFFLLWRLDSSENPLKPPLFFAKRPLCAAFSRGVGLGLVPQFFCDTGAANRNFATALRSLRPHLHRWWRCPWRLHPKT